MLPKPLILLAAMLVSFMKNVCIPPKQLMECALTMKYVNRHAVGKIAVCG